MNFYILVSTSNISWICWREFEVCGFFVCILKLNISKPSNISTFFLGPTKLKIKKLWLLKKNKFCIHRWQKKYTCIPPTFSFNFSWSSHRNASKPWISPMVATLALFQKQAWWNQFGIYGQQKTISIAYVEATQEIVIKYGFFLLYSSNIYHLLK